MHIVVLLKQVHDPNIPRTSLRITADGRALLLPAGSSPILNGYDANALEESLRMREAVGGRVTALAFGSDSAKESLRRAIAMGADKAVHLLGASGLGGDSDITATLLAAAIRTLGPVDLVLAGRSASDTDAGVVPLLVATQLGLPAVTPVRALAVEEGGAVLADRLTDAGIRRLRIVGAAVIGVSGEINKPRTPQLKGVVAAKRAAIPTVSAAELGVAAVEPAWHLRRLFLPERPVRIPEIVAANSPADAGRALADRLRQEGLV
jgi:electron transfer flavoprotein beta subunit